MPKKFGTGLFIGRFQPFHNGHMHAIRDAGSLCNELVVGVGSAQKSRTTDNPLPASVRIRIIKSALKESAAIKAKIMFLEIPDFHDNERWFAYIRKKVPKLDVVFSGNPIVKTIFRGHDIQVIAPKWYNRADLSGTKVRAVIRRSGKWERMVPKGAVSVIKANERAITAGPKQ
jgi:nicotinamide-nucleotide adenylyltransferase